MKPRSPEAAQFLFRLLESSLDSDPDESGSESGSTWKELVGLAAIVILLTAVILRAVDWLSLQVQ